MISGVAVASSSVRHLSWLLESTKRDRQLEVGFVPAPSEWRERIWDVKGAGHGEDNGFGDLSPLSSIPSFGMDEICFFFPEFSPTGLRLCRSH